MYFVIQNIKKQACDHSVYIYIYVNIKMTGKNTLFHFKVQQENR